MFNIKYLIYVCVTILLHAVLHYTMFTEFNIIVRARNIRLRNKCISIQNS